MNKNNNSLEVNDSSTTKIYHQNEKFVNAKYRSCNDHSPLFSTTHNITTSAQEFPRYFVDVTYTDIYLLIKNI